MLISHGFACSVILAAGTWSTPAFAQFARIDMSHDDLNGQVNPGETIRVTAMHSRERESGPPMWLGHIEGDVLTTPNQGHISGFSSPYVPPLSLWTASGGLVSGGSLLGFAVDFFAHPSIIMLHPPQSISPLIELLSFDFTAPDVAVPTVFTFEWRADPNHPMVEVWFPSSLAPEPIPTSYTSASIVVLPAPGAGMVVGVGGLLAIGRRRPRA